MKLKEKTNNLYKVNIILPPSVWSGDMCIGDPKCPILIGEPVFTGLRGDPAVDEGNESIEWTESVPSLSA